MNFRNTSKNVAIENLKMTVGNPASENENDVAAFTPAKSSNTFFIDKVSAGEIFTREIALFPKVDAAPKSYGVTVKYTYEAVIDGNRLTDLSGEETISIPLTQPDRFEISDPDIYGVSFGEDTTLTINYVNKGKTSIYNLSVVLEGNFSSGDMNTYVGNVDSGTGDYFETSLTPQEEGMLEGKAIFTYEDSNGDTKKIEKTFSCEITPGATFDPNYDPSLEPTIPEQESGTPAWITWVVAGVGGVVSIVALVLISRKIKERRERILDAEDDYDDTIENEDKES